MNTIDYLKASEKLNEFSNNPEVKKQLFDAKIIEDMREIDGECLFPVAALPYSWLTPKLVRDAYNEYEKLYNEESKRARYIGGHDPYPSEGSSQGTR
jgi:hypothetical protein